MSISLAIAKWSGWQGSSDEQISKAHLTLSELPDVSQIPAMLRRRLNLLGRACASEVIKHIEPEENTPIIYCSQHGDIERTLSVLNAMIDGEPISPTHFSLAVHNAICGVLSIQLRNTANITALATSSSPLTPVLLEAAGLLESGEERVLCVICDVPLPSIYQDENSSPISPFSISFLVTKELGTKLTLQQLIKNDPLNESITPATDFLEFLSSPQQELELKSDSGTWKLLKE